MPKAIRESCARVVVILDVVGRRVVVVCRVVVVERWVVDGRTVVVVRLVVVVARVVAVVALVVAGLVAGTVVRGGAAVGLLVVRVGVLTGCVADDIIVVVSGMVQVLDSFVVVSNIVVVSSVVVCGSGSGGGRNIRMNMNEARMTTKKMPMKIAVCLSFLLFRFPPPMLRRSCGQWRRLLAR